MSERIGGAAMGNAGLIEAERLRISVMSVLCFLRQSRVVQRLTMRARELGDLGG